MLPENLSTTIDIIFSPNGDIINKAINKTNKSVLFFILNPIFFISQKNRTTANPISEDLVLVINKAIIINDLNINVWFLPNNKQNATPNTIENVIGCLKKEPLL